ncbi:hypothetical protein SY111_03150 [Ligilactobacillus agilis]|uniref:Uncharacterized protein n=1 Tax=Ligilactobacillus agilis TaxID=1601 RepID=A0A6F9XQY4_9LACO|nr:hypothetical protein SY111_03150 [Ligilactobacillus agilis]
MEGGFEADRNNQTHTPLARQFFKLGLSLRPTKLYCHLISSMFGQFRFRSTLS